MAKIRNRDMRTLQVRLDKVAKRLDTSMTRLIFEVIRLVGIAVVISTPVDTGFARANWRPSLNTPTSTPVSFLDPTGAATIARIELIAHQFRLGNQAFLTNRAPYIEDLNDGSSPQAPANYVNVAIREGTTEAIQNFGGI